MDLGLKNKVVLITGGSEGIGLCSAYSLSAEGAQVVICARRDHVLYDAASAIKAATNGKVLAIPTDVTQYDQIQNLFRQTISEFGRIDVLINNAGTSAAGHFSTVTDSDWQFDLDLKLFAAIRCSRLAIPYMQNQGGGRIINITNLSGKTPRAKSMPTSVSRAAGIALTKAMSKDYAADNILVNTVCIGLIKSSQHEHRWAEELESNKISLDDWYKRLGQAIPLGRVGEGHEASDVITFLASARASYITGVAINIDGGSSAVV